MRQAPLPESLHFGEIATLVESMVLTSLDAFVKRDVNIARSVLVSDDTVDRVRNEIQRQLVAVMQADPSSIGRALDHVIIARSLGRIGDHATNIAEDIIFLVQGIDVRHRALLREQPAVA